MGKFFGERTGKAQLLSQFLRQQLFLEKTLFRQELDYLEDYDGQLHAYEFKWNPAKNSRPPLPFAKTYPDASFEVVDPKTSLDFLKPG